MENNNQKNKVVCILGMHRSGTSMVSRILNICGVYLGESGEIMSEPVMISNQKGHWENLKVLEINEEILNLFGGSWDDPPEFPENWERDFRLADIEKKAIEFREKMNRRSVVWGFKEPRTCLTLLFWKKIIPNMTYVIPIRSSIEVAWSLKKRDGFTLLKGIKLWAIYWGSILKNTNSEKKIFTLQKNYIVDWKKELGPIIEFIKSDKVDIEGKERIIDDFIAKDLVHNRVEKKIVEAGLNSGFDIEQLIFNDLNDGIIESENELNEIISKKDKTIEQKEVEIKMIKSSKFWKARIMYMYLKNKILFTIFSPRKFVKKYFKI